MPQVWSAPLKTAYGLLTKLAIPSPVPESSMHALPSEPAPMPESPAKLRISMDELSYISDALLVYSQYLRQHAQHQRLPHVQKLDKKIFDYLSYYEESTQA
ncbi:hypothetical protein [Eisenibacter elegans]|uniref:hypothetical protein n=1 Tax=Eisenibacter elegans TaxID=997 RepID=UPI00137801CB|nr:hypothetical protein [Eisenibacter elegans]